MISQWCFRSSYHGYDGFHSRIKEGSMDCFVNLRALRYKTANEPMVEAWQWSPLPICNASSLNHLSHSDGGLSHTMRNSNCPLDEDEKNRRLCDDWHCQLTIAVTQITEQCVDSFGFGYKRSQLWVPGCVGALWPNLKMMRWEKWLSTDTQCKHPIEVYINDELVFCTM